MRLRHEPLAAMLTLASHSVHVRCSRRCESIWGSKRCNRAPRANREELAMTMRPDPTFHASPKLAMEAPPENFAYTLLLSPDFSKPDALAVIDVKPGSPTFSKVVHTVTMPHKGDEFHHFGWNACSSAL